MITFIESTNGEDIIYASKKAEDVKAAVEEAVKKDVSLRGANLAGAYLVGANLEGADLESANLANANLAGVNLTGANLVGADLTGTNLETAKLEESILNNANLHKANLRFVSFKRASLFCAKINYAALNGADFRGANLNNASFRDTNLLGVLTDDSTKYFKMCCPSEGSFVGWKKARGNVTNTCVIVKLLITEDSKRSSATSKRCRCSKAKVLEIQNLDGTKDVKNDYAYSTYDNLFHYVVGETVEVKDFDEDRWNTFSTGIHFFVDREEAENVLIYHKYAGKRYFPAYQV